MYVVSILSVVCALSLFSTVESSACTDGMQAGRQKAEGMWRGSYRSDCNQMNTYINVVTNIFVGGSSTYEKSFNDCANIEIDKVVEEVKGECMTPHYCDEAGKEAAATIIALYTAEDCVISNVFASPTDSHIEDKCRQFATEYCETHIPEAYEEFYGMATCKTFGPHLSWSELSMLQADCAGAVDNLIG